MKTSTNNPIRVDFLSSEALGLAGRIGLTIAPGKKDALREWDRDLAADLRRLVQEYETNLLVSLMEDHEYPFLQIPDLLDRARALGIETLWFPIPDLNAPPAKEMPEFIAMIRRIVDATREGQTVVIHCRGGLGRSGVVAAACLVALGEEPTTATARVRAVRPGAVEYPVQERWVDAFAKKWPTQAPPRAGRAERPEHDRVLGCLLGGALGDALGYPVEFFNHGDIEGRFGAAAPAELNHVGGGVAKVTDDTQMTLFTAEGLIRARQRAVLPGAYDPIEIIAGALLRWHATQGESGRPSKSAQGWLVTERRLHARRAPGSTCMSALGALDRSGNLQRVGTPQNDSKGCGAVMRVAPCGLAAARREDAFALARDSGVITHGHPSGYLSAAYFASVIWDLARGSSLTDAMAAADALLAEERGRDELVAILARARRLAEKGAPDRATVESLGEGWVGEEALAIALLCALTFDRAAPNAVASTLWRAALHLGDSDSTAAITGNLLGAMLGASALPERWLGALELRDVIERVAGDLHRSCVLGEALDLEAYPPN